LELLRLAAVAVVVPLQGRLVRRVVAVDLTVPLHQPWLVLLWEVVMLAAREPVTPLVSLVLVEDHQQRARLGLVRLAARGMLIASLDLQSPIRLVAQPVTVPQGRMEQPTVA
jgi:hypothetical protein